MDTLLNPPGQDGQNPLADLFAALQAADPPGPGAGDRAAPGAQGSRGGPGGKRPPLVALELDPGQNREQQSPDWAGAQRGKTQTTAGGAP